MTIDDLDRQPVWLRLILIALSLVAVALFDVVTGPQIATSVFYLVPVGLVTLGFGRTWGFAASCFAAIIWFSIDLRTTEAHYDLYIHIWNAVVRLIYFAALTWLLGALVERIRREEQRAASCPLTGLPNGPAFRNILRLASLRKRRDGAAMSLLRLDIDGLRAVTDRNGREEADRLLLAVSDSLRVQTGDGDQPARLGGGAFAVLLPDRGAPEALEMAHKLHRTLKERLARNAWTVSIAIGAVTFEALPEDADGMLAFADAALGEAKRDGAEAVFQDIVDQAALA